MKHFYLLVIISLFSYAAADKLIQNKRSVIDREHHLEWQDNREAKEDIWKLSVGYCNQLKLNSYDNWRLPSKKELSQLFKSESIKQKFIYLEDSIYWSKSLDSNDNFNAFTVYSGNGFQSLSDKCEKNAIICVRDY